MRRLAAVLVLCAIAGAIAALLVGGSAQGSSTASFDVIFDDARGLIGGQLVKIAGAKAGTISNVTVVDQNGVFRAKVQASIDSKFMPFRQDATCSIRPEGLIAENYVNCNPGTAGSPPLRGINGQPPTVPVNHTSEPVSLLDLFNIFNLPTRERFQVIINELGIGTAGEGDDFNAIIRRANPALALANQAIGILARQKAQLAQIIDASSTIAAQGAGHTAAVQSFLDHAAALTHTTAAHSGPLAQAIRQLPATLGATQPALAQLDSVAANGTPLLQELDRAVPSLNRVADDLGPFVTAAKPGLAKLGRAITTAIPAIRSTTPLVKTLRGYLGRSLPSTRLFSKLLVNVQQRGVVENFLSILYYIAAATAREDKTSHLLSVLLLGPGNGLCAPFATKPSAICSAHFAPQGGAGPAAGARPTAGTTARVRAGAAHTLAPARGRAAAPGASAPSSAPRAHAAAPAGSTGTAGLLGLGGQGTPGGGAVEKAVRAILGYLLK